MTPPAEGELTAVDSVVVTPGRARCSSARAASPSPGSWFEVDAAGSAELRGRASATAWRCRRTATADRHRRRPGHHRVRPRRNILASADLSARGGVPPARGVMWLDDETLAVIELRQADGGNEFRLYTVDAALAGAVTADGRRHRHRHRGRGRGSAASPTTARSSCAGRRGGTDAAARGLRPGHAGRPSGGRRVLPDPASTPGTTAASPGWAPTVLHVGDTEVAGEFRPGRSGRSLVHHRTREDAIRHVALAHQCAVGAVSPIRSLEDSLVRPGAPTRRPSPATSSPITHVVLGDRRLHGVEVVGRARRRPCRCPCSACGAARAVSAPVASSCTSRNSGGTGHEPSWMRAPKPCGQDPRHVLRQAAAGDVGERLDVARGERRRQHGEVERCGSSSASPSGRSSGRAGRRSGSRRTACAAASSRSCAGRSMRGRRARRRGRRRRGAAARRARRHRRACRRCRTRPAT